MKLTIAFSVLAVLGTSLAVVAPAIDQRPVIAPQRIVLQAEVQVRPAPVSRGVVTLDTVVIAGTRPADFIRPLRQSYCYERPVEFNAHGGTVRVCDTPASPIIQHTGSLL